jgi:hypothetical protein
LRTFLFVGSATSAATSTDGSCMDPPWLIGG